MATGELNYFSDHWFAVYTKPRSEKKVADRLLNFNIGVYCPTRINFRQWSDRVKKVEVPFFTSYVFVKVRDEKERLQVLTDPGVVRYVHWLSQPVRIRDTEMDTIRNFLLKYNDLHISIENVQMGESIDIQSGMFKGVTGVVVAKNKSKISLLINTLGIKLIVSIT